MLRGSFMKLLHSYLQFTQIRFLLTLMLGALSTNPYVLKKKTLSVKWNIIYVKGGLIA
jgi:hypothetical protein